MSFPSLPRDTQAATAIITDDAQALEVAHALAFTATGGVVGHKRVTVECKLLDDVGVVFLGGTKAMQENVAYGLKVRGESTAQCNERARHWITVVGLQGYEQAFIHQLSGGMRQRVGLARALATDTEIILMDEAFSALDPLIRAEMQDQLLELQRTLQKTIVFITHDLDEALRIGNRIAILKDGQLVQVGTPQEILHNPADDYVNRFVQRQRAKIE